MNRYEAVVIGVSAGGLSALSLILEELPADFPLPIIIVQHRARDERTLLEEVLQTKCKILIKQADEKERIQVGTVYFAPPDYHLLIEGDYTFSLTYDAPVNYSRPSIDVLFETAASVFKDKLIAIVLTGASSDGADGIKEVRKHGGLTIAQDPKTAAFPYMPQAAINGEGVQLIWGLDRIKDFYSISEVMYSAMKGNQKVSILIVDDQPKNIFALEQMLAKPERTFISATDGVDALKIALNRNIDLIVLDVQMPEMDGFEVAQILKTNKRTKDIPIIFATAEKKEHEFVMKGFEEGGIDYLYKPLDPKITEAKVSVLLHLHLQKKELIAKNATLEKYALLINNSADLICIINANTLQFEEVNDAALMMLGYPTEELKGTSLLSYLSEEDQLRTHQFSKEDREKFSLETQFYSKNGSIKWLHWNVVSKNGLWFGNARDISQQKKSEQEIKQLNIDLKRNVSQLELTNKELESFSYSISHDLRAPLRAITGYAQIIQDEYENQFDDELKRLFGIIQKNAKRMGVLIDDLLAFSRMGRRELSKAYINFNDLVHAVINDLHYERKKDIQFDILPLASTDGDYNLLYQVFTNLISNATKYSSKRENPKVEIGSTEREDEFIYYIKDNGVGFNMDYSNKLFGVFQRLHSNEEFEGTGVGLAIVQRIITKHGGRVWAEGEVDKGAIFYFSLPKPFTS